MKIRSSWCEKAVNYEATLRDELHHPGCVSFVGPGGLGKSEIVGRVLSQLSQSQWVIRSRVWHETAEGALRRTLGSRSSDLGHDLAESVAELVGHQRLILALELGAGRPADLVSAVGAIVASVPTVTVLVVGLAEVGLPDERCIRIAPPTLPPPAVHSLADLEQSEAGQLLMERLYLVDPRRHVTDRDAPAMAELCRLVDGNPLALQLLATRIPALGVEGVLAGLPVPGPRSAEPAMARSGHRSVLPLAELVGQAMAELDERQRELLRWLVQQHGPVSPATILGSGPRGDDHEDPCAVLGGMVDLLLIHPRQYRSTRLFESASLARMFIGEIPRDESDGVLRRLLEWYTSRGREVSAKDSLPSRFSVLNDLKGESDNIFSVVGTALDRGLVMEAAAAASALAECWHTTGDVRRARLVFDRLESELRSLDGGPVVDLARADLLVHAAEFEQRVVNSSVNAHKAREALAIATRYSSIGVEARALRSCGAYACIDGDYRLGAQYYQSSIERFRELGDEVGVATVLSNLSEIAVEDGDHDQAVALLRSASEVFRAHGELGCESANEYNLAQLFLDRGDHLQARNHIHRALDSADRSNFIALVPALLTMGARCCTAFGEHREALIALSCALHLESGEDSFVVEDEHSLGPDAARLAESVRVCGPAFEAEAAVLARQLGLDGAIARLRSVLEPRASHLLNRIPVAAADHAGATEPGELTRRERQIMELVARGYSNTDVAQTLELSRRTVDKHLERAFRKLGVRSRTEAVYRMREQAPAAQGRST